MNANDIHQLLQGAMRGERAMDELLAAIDGALATAPDVAAEFMQRVEAQYARSELRYDAFLMIKDRYAAARRNAPTGPTGARAADRAAGSTPQAARPAPAPDATQLRSKAPENPDPDATRLRAPTRGAAPDATVLRPESAATTATGADAITAAPAAATGQTGGVWDEGSWTQTTEQPLEPGSLIKGRFLLEERVGAGGMGVVFKARDLRKEEAQDRDPYVAIKFLSPDFRRHPESLKALQRETRRAQSLAHPNVVTVYDFDRDGTLIYMTMEYLAGEPLDRFIQRHPQGLRFNEAWPIIEGAGRALMYAHEQGVVHADFKPGNVFVVDRKAKVLDFGIARAIKAQADTGDRTQFDAGSLGALTPAYASPEMLLDQATDPRDDIYALACVAYELMTGRHPFNGVPALQAMHDGMKLKRAPGIGRYQFKAIEHGLAFRQADRTRTVEAFLDEIAGPFGRKGRALRQAVLSTASTAIILTAVGGALWWYTRPDPDKQLQRRLIETATAQFAEARSGGKDAQALDPELVKVLLEQGTDYLASGRQSFDPALLSEGVSSALGAFQEVLRMDPQNRSALDGIVEIVHLYEAEIQRAAEAGQDARVIELAGFARKIDPNRPSLEQLESEARARQGTAAPAQP